MYDIFQQHKDIHNGLNIFPEKIPPLQELHDKIYIKNLEENKATLLWGKENNGNILKSAIFPVPCTPPSQCGPPNYVLWLSEAVGLQLITRELK